MKRRLISADEARERGLGAARCLVVLGLPVLGAWVLIGMQVISRI